VVIGRPERHPWLAATRVGVLPDGEAAEACERRCSTKGEELAMKWKLTLAALAALVVAGVTPAGAGPSQQAKAVSVNFRMVEWDILPLTATKTRSARVTFVVRNAGKMTHEFVVLKTAKAAGSLAAPGAREAPETGARGEIEEIKPGETKRLTLSLKKGHYSLICNLPFHYGKGQFVDFYIR
jgi:uncharacterized cupredoxin-like copper-binding protein